MISENSVIRDGDYSILQKVGGEQLRPCRLLSGQRVLIEKLSFDPTIAFGKPFGIFEVSSNGKTPTVSSQNESFSDIQQIEHCESKVQQNDNINQKQSMTADDIAKLKAEGSSTENLVSKLVNGNSFFKDRSQFSKEKYVRKMTKKHSGKVMISRPNIRLLCQSYFYKDPERLAHL
uniref:tRNA (adenine(58)-N(1))-methyltransferase non-catalytic subunit TRM6 n=1 Tax=Meloidogyne javanica TaxID=6303 RepID=A0A915LXW4_MELJA